jgi:hypothetical protein
MSIKVVSYLATLPRAKTPESVAKNTSKANTLKYYAEGATMAGDHGIVTESTQWQPADVAVILGWVHEHGKTSAHLEFRREILEKQQQHGGRTVVADSNLFLYRNTSNPGYWLRYSYDGIFPNTGEYCDSQPSPDRWNLIQEQLGVSLKPYRDNGNHVLMCLQRDGGWSMRGFNVVDWALEKIIAIRKHSDRVIRIRPHPGDRRAVKYMSRLVKLCQGRRIANVEISRSDASLVQDLQNCWCVVNHNSSPAVGAVIEGIPVFVTDPVRSQCQEVANRDLTLIENPVMLDRTAWAQRISQFHWSHADLRSGACWTHMRKWAHT